MEQAMLAQFNMAPEMIAMEKSLMPRLQELQMLGLRGQANNMFNLMGEFAPLAAQRTAEYNEMMSPVMGRLGVQARENYMQTLGGGADILNSLTSQANAGLAAGQGLTREEQDYINQVTRASYAARGLGTSGNAAVAEALNSFQMRRANEDRNRGFAANVLGLNTNVANTGYQLFGQPLMANTAAYSPSGMLGISQQFNQAVGPNYLRPESQAAFDINSANQSMDFQARAASSANKAAITGAIIGGIGTMAGGWAKGLAMRPPVPGGDKGN
jgi:hypothetical protein